ncbi:MAG: prepilin-type N-terminal cleavage/methylation domain-containing protein [Sulfurovum sp.]|nr:prepilin-type N-terminal cleavage/methylation domain-containing protein [Sulfurovum sp.]
MQTTRKKRAGFSMLELVFVIVILGIVSSIGAEVIAKVYESYIVQRAQHRASIKTQLAMNQIVNRLRYVIPGTMVRRVTKTGTPELVTNDMVADSTGNDYNVLQWVAMDGDSFEAISTTSNTGTGRRPGWSGFCDVTNSTSETSLSTPGSKFSITTKIRTNLGYTGKFAIFFPGDDNATAHFGTGSGSTITLDANPDGRIVERYKLARSSYALVVENSDLFLYYNFTPQRDTPINGTKSLLLKNVSNFKFQRRGMTTRIKICAEEPISEDVNISSCKEKAVF